MGARSIRQSRTTRWGAVLLAGLLLAAPLSAATMRALSLDELVQTSDRVVLATVVSNESRWNDEHTRIYTYTTIRVDEYLKGDGASGDTLVIRTLGGAVGEMGLHVEGAPVFRPGDREVIFLTPQVSPDQNFTVQGWNQGRFKVLEQPETGQEMVIRPLAGTRILQKDGQKALSEFSTIRTLDHLRTAVRSRIQKGE